MMSPAGKVLKHNGQRSFLVEENFVPIHGILNLNLYQSYTIGMFLNNCYIGEYVNSESVGSHSLFGNCKIKRNKSTKGKHKILIIGDNQP